MALHHRHVSHTHTLSTLNYDIFLTYCSVYHITQEHSCQLYAQNLRTRYSCPLSLQTAEHPFSIWMGILTSDDE